MPERMYMNGSWYPQSRIAVKVPSKVNWLMMIASIVAAVAMIVVVVAFATASWLEADNFSIQPILPFGMPFDRLGLWQICFRIYGAGLGTLGGYSRMTLSGLGGYGGLGGLGGLGGFGSYSTICRWFLNNSWEPMTQYTNPVFFIVTQGMYALGLLTSIIATILLICVLFREKTCRVLYVIGSMFLLSSGFICASFVVFGSFVYYDDQWVLFQATNFLSWSFAAAIAGFILLVITGILFMVAGRRKQQQEQFSNAHVLPSNLIPTHSIGGTIVASELPMQPDRLYTMSLPPGSTKHEEMLNAYSPIAARVPAPTYVNEAFELPPKPRERVYSFASARMGPVHTLEGGNQYGRSSPARGSPGESHAMAHVTTVNRHSEETRYISPNDMTSRRTSIAMTNV